MVKLEQKVEFEAVVKDDVISVSAKAVEGLAATQDTSGNIFHNYAVLAVDNECLLLSRGQSSSGAASREIQACHIRLPCVLTVGTAI
ncbi:hypothetical protein MRX96_020120 [Rhipicephalus microplus]